MSIDNEPVRFFSIQNAKQSDLDRERIAVLGYGHLGSPFALNLRDSGLSTIVIGNIDDEFAKSAKADGFEVLSIQEATSKADIVIVLLPDEVIPDVFSSEISPNLSSESALVFASGYNLAYELITPPDNVDVLMLAPRMGGLEIRERFLDQQGFFAYISVEQDFSGNAWSRLLCLARFVGVLDAGALELSAHQEADLDLLIEQTLGAALGVAMMNVFALGVDAGIPPEAMVMEMYMSGEMESVWRAFRQEGFFRSSGAHGPTALFGGFLRTMQLMNSDLIEIFRKTFKEIKSGDFARQFQTEREAGYPMLSQAQSMRLGDNPIVQAEERVRKMLTDK